MLNYESKDDLTVSKLLLAMEMLLEESQIIHLYLCCFAETKKTAYY